MDGGSRWAEVRKAVSEKEPENTLEYNQFHSAKKETDREFGVFAEMNHTIYAYPSKQRPDLPKKKFKGLSKAEMEAKYQELLKEGYTRLMVERC